MNGQTFNEWGFIVPGKDFRSIADRVDSEDPLAAWTPMKHGH